MQGRDVYDVLLAKGATHLFHANSVTTSCTFLEQGGLASRAYVEEQGLAQTPQDSDEKDKKYGVWDCIFLDHVDIHDRAQRANVYGPVLFRLDLDVLLTLPGGSDVLVTKSNPLYWMDGQAEADRYYLTPDEVRANLMYGNFDKMIVIRTPSKTLAFPNGRANIILDDPQQKVTSGEDAHLNAVGRLVEAGKRGGTSIGFTSRVCRAGCRCLAEYAGKDVDFWFR